jgi:hypothetical protein
MRLAASLALTLLSGAAFADDAKRSRRPTG